MRLTSYVYVAYAISIVSLHLVIQQNPNIIKSTA